MTRWRTSSFALVLLLGGCTRSNPQHPTGGNGDVVGVGIDFGSDAGIDMAVPADMTAPGCNCGTGLTCCNGACVDLTSDPNNCGLCGAVCATGRCGSSFGYSAGNWSFNGTATFDPGLSSIMLTAAVSNQTGSAIHKDPIATSSFDVSFDFRILAPPMTIAADGMGFFIQKGGPGVVGGPGGGLGMVGLDGFGVELDPYDNDPAKPDCGDSSPNHVAIDSLSPCLPTGGGQMPTPLFVSNNLTSYTPPITLADGNWHACHVVYTNGLLSVAIDGLQRVSGGLPGYSSGAGYYYGFAGATGGLVSRQDVRNVDVSFLVPQCL